MRQRLTISDSYHFQSQSIVGFQGVYVAGVLVITPFRQLNNLVNSIHKRALKFTYDDKGNKLNDIAPPNMKVCYQSLESCFVLSMFFVIFKYAIMRTISLHPNDHSQCLRKSNLNHLNIIYHILQFFGQSSLQESLCKNHIIFGNRNIF